MRKLLLAALTAALVAPAAVAGGWATAGVAPPPDDIQAGDVWNARITILQHGRTPLDGVQPTLTIRNDSGRAETFRAKPTGKPGEYSATVRFPSGGTWRYEVYDGFGRYGGAKTHTFAPVEVGGPSVGGSDTSVPVLPVAGVLGLVGLLAAVLVLARRRRPRPEVAPTA